MERSDNTRVDIGQPDELQRLTFGQIREQFRKRLAGHQLYDADKVESNRRKQQIYNSNAFGAGIQGYQTNYNPFTQQSQIESNFDYAKDNAISFLSDVGTTALSPAISSLVGNGWMRGIFPINGKLGNISKYKPYQIGEGAEAIVVDNTRGTVGKITQIPLEEMTVRNQIPHTVRSEFIGTTTSDGVSLPTYIQKKVKVLTEETFPRYIEKLDRAMQKSGFRRVNDPNVQYRAYTNGEIVVDDIAPGNVGLNWLRQPKIIDSSVQTVPEWLDMGFTLRKGGKIFR